MNKSIVTKRKKTNINTNISSNFVINFMNDNFVKEIRPTTGLQRQASNETVPRFTIKESTQSKAFIIIGG